MKTITLLLDGIGDRVYKELDLKTPLEYSKTPNLNKLCSNGYCGMMTPLSPGVELGTELAHFLMFGYKLNEYPGRAVIDCFGEDKDFSDKEIVLRTSWANVSIEKGFFLNERFVKEMKKEDSIKLSESLVNEIDGFKFRWEHSYDSHGFLFIEGEGLSANISDSDPFYNNQYVMKVEEFEDESNESKLTANILNRFLVKSSKRLIGNPINLKRAENGFSSANFLLTKWAGKIGKLESFYERNGMKGAIIGKSNLLKGLARLLQMEYFEEGNFKNAVEMAVSLEGFDYIHVHTKLPDEAAHKKDPFEKVKAIETIDKAIEPIFKFKDGIIVVTGDHSTPSFGKCIHSGDDVPIMFLGEKLRRDSVLEYGERQCARGSFRMSGEDFIPMILNFSNRTKLFHLRAGKKRRLYTPNEVNMLEDVYYEEE